MMVECLAGALAATAASLAPEANVIPKSGAMAAQGAFLWMVKPGAFVEGDLFAATMTQWTGRYQTSGGEAAHLPGRRGAQLEARAREQGIPLPASLLQDLQALAGRCSIALPTA
jgi:LDH2 family malate/lactate/ureidoglycolate dehydrogenase